jgi:hypothetical protein
MFARVRRPQRIATSAVQLPGKAGPRLAIEKVSVSIRAHPLPEALFIVLEDGHSSLRPVIPILSAGVPMI